MNENKVKELFDLINKYNIEKEYLNLNNFMDLLPTNCNKDGELRASRYNDGPIFQTNDYFRPDYEKAKKLMTDIIKEVGTVSNLDQSI